MIELALLREKLTGLLLELLTCKLQNNSFLDIIVNISQKIHFWSRIPIFFFFCSI